VERRGPRRWNKKGPKKKELVKVADVRGVSFGANVWRRGRWEEGKGASSPGLSSAL